MNLLIVIQFNLRNLREKNNSTDVMKNSNSLILLIEFDFLS